MHKPSKKIVWIWELYVLLAPALLTALSFLLFRFPIPSWIGWAFIGLWALICAFFAAFYIPVAYHRMQYGIVDGKLVARSGVIYDSCKSMPLSSIKYVMTVRGPLEQLMGLTMLLVFSAGGLIIVNGLTTEEGRRLHDRLLPGMKDRG